MSLSREFRSFALKGNVVDMAVGIVIGGAFGAIVKSLVDDILMPPIGVLTGGVDFERVKVVLKEAVPANEAAGIAAEPAVTMNVGSFANFVITFLIVALAVFVLIRAMNRLRARAEEAPEEPPVPPRQEVLLEEIRDLLAQS